MPPVISRREMLKIGGIALVSLPLGCGPAGEEPPALQAWDLPRITPNDDFYVVLWDKVPEVDSSAWRLELTGGFDGARLISLAELQALPARTREHTLECIGASPRNPAISNAVWTGLPLVEILEHFGVRVQPSTTSLLFECADAYVTGIPSTDLVDQEVWLVWKMNGEPLPAAHGAPARLLVPGRYGLKNPKWLTRITAGDETIAGTWEAQGWSYEAVYRATGFILRPRSADAPHMKNAPVRLMGSAYCGQVPITRIEISDDAGATWRDVDVEHPGGDSVWTIWKHDWTPPGPGQYRFMLRVAAADGQHTLDDDMSEGAGYEGYGRIQLTVT